MLSSFRCPVCASTEQEWFRRVAPAQAQPALLRCRSCRFIYPSAPLAAHAGGAEAPWVTAMSAGGDLPDGMECETWVSLVESAVMRGRLLDIGACHPFIDLATRCGWQADEIVMPPDAAHAAAFPPLDYQGVWPAGLFDAVTIWHLLEYHPCPEAMVQLAAHYCRIDGVLAVRMMNADTASPAPCAERRSRLFSIPALQRLFSRFGFRIERIERTRRAGESVARWQAALQEASRRTHVELGRLSVAERPRLTHERMLLVLARYIP